LALIRVCFQAPSIGLLGHRVTRADLCAEMLLPSTCSRDIARVINTGIARALFLTSQSAARLYQAPHNSIGHVLALAWPPLRD